jgi:hypothetical protein
MSYHQRLSLEDCALHPLVEHYGAGHAQPDEPVPVIPSPTPRPFSEVVQEAPPPSLLAVVAADDPPPADAVADSAAEPAPFSASERDSIRIPQFPMFDPVVLREVTACQRIDADLAPIYRYLESPDTNTPADKGEADRIRGISKDPCPLRTITYSISASVSSLPSSVRIIPEVPRISCTVAV